MALIAENGSKIIFTQLRSWYLPPLTNLSLPYIFYVRTTKREIF